eukprot:TRINITY_DN8836_c0_g1_i1.p1 TRINITY_DN8836_c0_g1~~TRINITY_DN8836_c0_g1_i1.p1  ORF type:complete len:615 (+),score=110.57 TRINITY_DN8836_c0_g1_i1:125-1969(+)
MAEARPMAFEDRQSVEVSLAQMENRLRSAITDLVHPSVQRTTQAVADIDLLKGIVAQHTRGLQEMQIGQYKALEQVSTIASFKEEMTRWDTQRKTHEASIDEKIATMQGHLETYKYSLEQKESALHHLHRSVDRMSLEVNRLIDEQDAQRETVDSRFDAESLKANKMNAELHVKLNGLEMKHNAVSDELWGEETGLAKVGGELLKTNAALVKLETEVDELHKGKAEAAQLDRLRSEVAKTVHEANSTVAALRHTVGTVVSDVREHFRTASQTISAHNAAFVAEVRSEYQAELQSAAQLRGEVKGFIATTDKELSVVRARVSEADAKASALASEVREEIEELNRRRKRDKTHSDNELMGLKLRLGGVFDNSDQVTKRMEHIYQIIRVMLESEHVQCSVELQDSIDRSRIALMGVKDEDTTLSRTTHNTPQYPRPECRAKSAPGGPKRNQGARGGSLSARNPQEAVVNVESRCLSCSGQAPLVLSAFKMACLRYTSSPVQHKGRLKDRHEWLEDRQALLNRAQTSLLAAPLGQPFRSPQDATSAQSPSMGGAGAAGGCGGDAADGTRGTTMPQTNSDFDGAQPRRGDALAEFAFVEGWQGQKTKDTAVRLPGLRVT